MIIILPAKVLSNFFPVLHMPTQTSHDRGSPMWLFPVVIGVSVFLIAAVVVFRLRGHRCRRNLAYEQHIHIQQSFDEKVSGEHFTTAKI